MKLKEALPDFDDTLWDRPVTNKQKIRKLTPVPVQVQRQDLEVQVDQMNDGSYRAMIKSIKGERYGSKPSHPKEFMASGRTPEAAKEELFKKLKI